MQVNGYQTKELYNGNDFTVSTENGNVVVRMGDHAIVLSKDEATKLALGVGFEVVKQGR